MPLGIPFPLSLMPDRSAPARTSTSKRTTLRRFYSRSPFPHMHYCTFVIIGAKGDPDALVAGALAPFDEALQALGAAGFVQDFLPAAVAGGGLRH